MLDFSVFLSEISGLFCRNSHSISKNNPLIAAKKNKNMAFSSRDYTI